MSYATPTSTAILTHAFSCESETLSESVATVASIVDPAALMVKLVSACKENGIEVREKNIVDKTGKIALAMPVTKLLPDLDRRYLKRGDTSLRGCEAGQVSETPEQIVYTEFSWAKNQDDERGNQKCVRCGRVEFV